MAESTLALTHADYKRIFIRAWKGTVDYSALNANEQAVVNDAVKAAYRRFILAHGWSFLRPVKELFFSGPYSTGTVAVAAGVVTLSGVGASFPTWAASGEIVISQVAHRVSVRDSNTQLTLANTNLTVAAGTSYELIRTAYDMEDDFADLEGTVSFVASTNDRYPPMQRVGEVRYRELRRSGDLTGLPAYWALQAKPKASATTGTRWQLLVHPAADDADTYIGVYRYTRIPDALSGDTDVPYGGALFSEVLKEAVLAVWEADFEDMGEGLHERKYQQLLAEAIAADSNRIAADNLGPNLDRSDRLSGDPDDSRFGTFRGGTSITLNL
jgi:hypothetical protein